MSFKHGKFEDSSIMRSFEKVALQKGLVTPDVIVKSASSFAKESLAPTNDLSKDIIKLCVALRKENLNTHADLIESKFMQFKKANALYNTSKETGEDMIDTAHPDGSFKLEGVSGDCVVETIIDKHLKMVETINKKPTGKLANLQAINKVKIVLGSTSGNLTWGLIGDTDKQEWEKAKQEKERDIYYNKYVKPNIDMVDKIQQEKKLKEDNNNFVISVLNAINSARTELQVDTRLLQDADNFTEENMTEGLSWITKAHEFLDKWEKLLKTSKDPDVQHSMANAVREKLNNFITKQLNPFSINIKTHEKEE